MWSTYRKKHVLKKKTATLLQLNAALSEARTDNKCEKIKFIYLVYLYVLIFPKLEETPFHYRGLECKSRKSRNTWSKQANLAWSRAKANRLLPREHTGHSKHRLPTTQETTIHMDITRWSIPKSDGLYSLQPKIEKLYTDSKNKTGSWLWLRSWTPYAKFRIKLKKVWKTTRPSIYELNQIPYDYTVGMRNRFQELIW